MGRKRRREKSSKKGGKYISGADIIQMAQQNVRSMQRRAVSMLGDFGSGIPMETYRKSRTIITQLEGAKTWKEAYNLIGQFFKTIGGTRNIPFPFKQTPGWGSWFGYHGEITKLHTKEIFGKPYYSLYFAMPPSKGKPAKWLMCWVNEKGESATPWSEGLSEKEFPKFAATALKQLPIKIQTTPGSQGYVQWKNPKTGMWEKIDIATRTVVARSPTKFSGVKLWKGER